MTEQDLRDKISSVERKEISSTKLIDQCVQIAKDYAEQEAIDFYEWRSTTPIKNIDQYTNKEAYQLFKNRENER